jgi:hypothetical protein
MKEFLKSNLIICIVLILISCDTSTVQTGEKENQEDVTVYIPSSKPIKVYDIYKLNDPISNYNWRGWEKNTPLVAPYDFNSYYSFSSDNSELSKFNNVIFNPINIYTINDTISKVELIAKEYIRERPSSYPEFILDKANVDQVIKIFKEKFGTYDKHLLPSFQYTQPEKYYWNLNDHTIVIEVNTFSRPFFVPDEKAKYDKYMNEINKKKTLLDKIDFSKKNEEKFDGTTFNLDVTSLKITFQSKYMDSITRDIYEKFDELNMKKDSLNRLKAKRKL